MDQALIKKAEAFRALHDADEILVLPNAWDVASARILAACGARAIGTTSMGVSAVRGLPDVQEIPFDEMLTAIAEIADGVDVPVTADMEAGYGETADEVAVSIRRAIEHGAVGVNVEDGTGDAAAPVVAPEVHVERIQAIRAMADGLGMPLVINARTDVVLCKLGDEREQFSEAVRRGNAYREAGADCVFVPGGLTAQMIGGLVKEISAPINVVANPAISKPVVPGIAELQDLGVARVSVGSGILRAILAQTRRIADELLRDGHYDSMKELLQEPQAPESYAMAIGEWDGA